MIENYSAIIVFALIIIIYAFLFLIPAYSQIPYLPNIQSLSEKNLNSTISTVNRSSNNGPVVSVSKYSQENTNNSSTSQSCNNNNAKVVIINFDDSHKNQYTYAKPVLDKYGFKATFFEVCNWVEAGHHDKDMTTTWKDIAELQQDGRY